MTQASTPPPDPPPSGAPAAGAANAAVIQALSPRDAGYPPSWLDRLLRAVDRLPSPWWSTYAAVFALGHALIAYLRVDAQGSWVARLLEPRVFWLWCLYLPAFTHYLGRVARVKLAAFEPVLGLDDDGRRRLAYRLTTMPFWPPVVWGGVSVLLGLATLRLNQGLVKELGFPPWEAWATVASYAVGGAAIYHSVHQLRTVSRIYGQVGELDLHHIQPVHALSSLTARTAAGWILLLVLTQALVPQALARTPAVEAGFALLIGLAATAFVAPLWGMHQRLEQEKAAALARLAAQARGLREQLQGAIAAGRLEGLDPAQKALGIVGAEREQLLRLSTWPWDPGSLRAFLSALLLPLVLRLLQGALGDWLGLN